MKNEMDGTCSAYGGKDMRIRVLVGKSEGKNHLGNPGVDRKIILRWISRQWDVGYGLD